MAVTHRLSACPTSTYVSPAHVRSGLPTFQAGRRWRGLGTADDFAILINYANPELG
jgi:hypothetical protein